VTRKNLLKSIYPQGKQIYFSSSLSIMVKKGKTQKKCFDEYAVYTLLLIIALFS
jgi:hypothetical protein